MQSKSAQGLNKFNSREIIATVNEQIYLIILFPCSEIENWEFIIRKRMAIVE